MTKKRKKKRCQNFKKEHQMIRSQHLNTGLRMKEKQNKIYENKQKYIECRTRCAPFVARRTSNR